jgi:hypothetical protein
LTPLTAKELTQINDLASEAMGFNKDPGDTLNVPTPLHAAGKGGRGCADLEEPDRDFGWVLELLRTWSSPGCRLLALARMVKPFEKLMEPGPVRPKAGIRSRCRRHDAPRPRLRRKAGRSARDGPPGSEGRRQR